MAGQGALFEAEWARPLTLGGAEVRIGTCSWSDPHFIKEGGFYPRGARSRPEARLRYNASVFSTVEVDATYYALLPTEYARRWMDWTAPPFDFHVKAFGLFTGHGIDPSRLPRHIQEFLPAPRRRAKRIASDDVPGEVATLCWEYFLNFLDTLREGGRLGYVLFQYPRWHRFSTRHLDEIVALRGVLRDNRIAVEFRHRSWVEPAARSRVLDALRAHDMIYVVPDEPALEWTVPPRVEVSADWSIVRFHGRNADSWARPGSDPLDAYRYDYSAAELRAWARKSRELAPQVTRLYLMFNNHTMGKAARNAVSLRALLER
jgi:uncharacterized protein YecE (DUF72 family)